LHAPCLAAAVHSCGSRAGGRARWLSRWYSSGREARAPCLPAGHARQHSRAGQALPSLQLLMTRRPSFASSCLRLVQRPWQHLPAAPAAPASRLLPPLAGHACWYLHTARQTWAAAGSSPHSSWSRGGVKALASECARAGQNTQGGWQVPGSNAGVKFWAGQAAVRWSGGQLKQQPPPAK